MITDSDHFHVPTSNVHELPGHLHHQLPPTYIRAAVTVAVLSICTVVNVACSVATLQHALGRLLQPLTLDALQQLLYSTFPKHLMEAHLQQFANSAWAALGASSLEVW